MIAVVVPTNRPDKIKTFLKNWKEQFEMYEVGLFIVHDGDEPRVEHKGEKFTAKDILGKDADLIYNKTDGVRNLGFALAYKLGYEIIISLDDDTAPYGDTIGDHLKALNNRYPISWMNTVDEVYMRGFPYGIREEAECVLSHGTWHGVADFDASTQLLYGTPEVTNRIMPVPKGILFPMCIMNVAFKRELMPFMYQAPMGWRVGLDRFADIWSGVTVKKAIDKMGKCAVTGYANVCHIRASDPFVNLTKEANGVKLNEGFWKGEETNYSKLYAKQLKRWQKFLKEE